MGACVGFSFPCSRCPGLAAISPVLRPVCVPIAMGVLAVLFYSQRYGAGKLGAVFGPFMVVYFLTVGAMGLTTIILTGSYVVFSALNPLKVWWRGEAVSFFCRLNFFAPQK